MLDVVSCWFVETVIGIINFANQKFYIYSEGSNTERPKSESIRIPNILKVRFRTVEPFENRTFQPFENRTFQNGRPSLGRFSIIIFFKIRNSLG